MKIKQLKYYNAFTMVELLIVISIIMILSAFFLPVLNKAQGRVKNIQCLNFLRQNITAVIQYCGDYNSYLPPVNYSKPTEDPFAVAQYTGQMSYFRSSYTTDNNYCVSYGLLLLYKYLPNEKTVYCPLARSLYKPAIGEDFWKVTGTYIYVGGLNCYGWATVKPRQRIANNAGVFVFRCNLPGGSKIETLALHGTNTSNTAYMDGHVESRKPVISYWNAGNYYLALDKF